jgi:hypothetical protein
MKSVRSLVLLTMLGVLPGFMLPITGQQEIDPDHFDQAELAKIAKPAPRSAAGHRAAPVKDRQKPTAGAPSTSRATASSRQPKAEKQRIAAVHSTSE